MAEESLIQRLRQEYFDSLPERWNTDGTRKEPNTIDADGNFNVNYAGPPLDNGLFITFPKPEEGQDGWLINNVQYVPICRQ